MDLVQLLHASIPKPYIVEARVLPVAIAIGAGVVFALVVGGLAAVFLVKKYGHTG